MKPSMTVHSCHCSTWELEAGKLQVWARPGLRTETLPLKHFSKEIGAPKQTSTDVFPGILECDSPTYVLLEQNRR